MRPAELCDWLTGHGIATVTTAECAHLLGVPRNEVPQRIARSRAKGHFVSLARGLWAAVPAEYRAMGAPEPMRYIDDLMAFLGRDYCVGWLAAAALHGASHQAPQVFQVAVSRQVRGRTVGRGALEFHERSYVGQAPARRVATSAGAALVASPGTTMLMACSDPLLCGGLDNVATIVAELAEEKADYLSDVVRGAALFPRSAVCRLGWLLENVAGASGLDELSALCAGSGEPAMLSPHGPRAGAVDKRWNVMVNKEVEADV